MCRSTVGRRVRAGTPRDKLNRSVKNTSKILQCKCADNHTRLQRSALIRSLLRRMSKSPPLPFKPQLCIGHALSCGSGDDSDSASEGRDCLVVLKMGGVGL